MSESQIQFCEVLANSVAVVTVGPDGDEEDIEVAEEGYECPNEAAGKYEIEVHGGGTMEFWACEEHRNEWEEDGVIVEEVETRD